MGSLCHAAEVGAISSFMGNHRGPANPLEIALLHAIDDPSKRPAFYQTLLAAELFFLTPEEAPQNTAEQIRLLHWDGPKGRFVPFFASLDRLNEGAAQFGSGCASIVLDGNEAFELLAKIPTAATLNPGLPYGKHFEIGEVTALSDGSIFQGQAVSVERATDVLIGQPEVYPNELVEALNRFFSSRADVEAAYLAQIHVPNSGVPSHPIVGIHCANFDRVVEEAGKIAQHLLRDESPVDFIEVDPHDHEGWIGFLQKETKPFYRRA